MAQHDYQLDNALGADFRSDLNEALLAIVSNNAGLDAPTKKFPGMLWLYLPPASAPGILRLRDAQDGNWLEVGQGTHLPLSGGTITGALAVAGIFSNPAFVNGRANYAGTTQPFAPAAANRGVLWFSTATNPGILKISTGSAWVDVVDKSSPSFTDNVTIVSTATGAAQLNLVSAGERRRIAGESAGSRWAFYGQPNDKLLAYITDAGEMWLASLNTTVSAALNSKQPALGFTPIQQWDGNAIQIGGNPAHLWLNNVDQGEISTGSDAALFQRGQLGTYALASAAVSVAGNATVSGANLSYYPGTADVVGVGTWRNMEQDATTRSARLFHRIA